MVSRACWPDASSRCLISLSYVGDRATGVGVAEYWQAEKLHRHKRLSAYERATLPVDGNGR